MADKSLRVIAGAPDQPLIINGIAVDCYVLEGGKRVLTQASFLTALGRSPRPSAQSDSQFDKLPTFLQSRRLQPFIPREFPNSTTPVKFSIPRGGAQAIGYDARLLPMVCETYLRAREAGALLPSQEHIAARAEILIRGLAEVGIIGLIDEATGYQERRSSRALAKILEQFIAKELREWVRTFPAEFYDQIYRLHGWDGPEGSNRPAVIGHITNNTVYARLAPGVLEEMKNRNPTVNGDYRRDKHHQWLTPDVGHPKLLQHLAAVIALMRSSSTWEQFMSRLDIAHPPFHEGYQQDYLLVADEAEPPPV